MASHQPTSTSEPLLLICPDACDRKTGPHLEANHVMTLSQLADLGLLLENIHPSRIYRLNCVPVSAAIPHVTSYISPVLAELPSLPSPYNYPYLLPSSQPSSHVPSDTPPHTDQPPESSASSSHIGRAFPNRSISVTSSVVSSSASSMSRRRRQRTRDFVKSYGSVTGQLRHSPSDQTRIEAMVEEEAGQLPFQTIIHSPAWGRPTLPSSQDSIPESIHSNLPGYNPAEDFFTGFPNEALYRQVAEELNQHTTLRYLTNRRRILDKRVTELERRCTRSDTRIDSLQDDRTM